MFKKYRVGFDGWGLVLFLLIMVPNFIWFAVTAPNDILRTESVTPTVDLIASICQIIMITAICLVKRREISKPIIRSKWILTAIIFCILYFISWFLYYQGIVSDVIVLSLCLFPCLSFLTYEIDRRNWIAFIPTAGFSVLHLTYGVLNFVL